jgi:ADP-ribose pyrophosphatase
MWESKRVYSGTRFHVDRMTRREGDRVWERDAIRHPGAVTILPLLDRDHLCLIENYRPTVEQTLLELPAGTLEAGEDPRSCAERELREETGYRAAKLEAMGSFFLSPGILDENMHLFVASELTADLPQREANEQIENRITSWEEALAMIRDGRIHDAKTIVALLRYERERR